MNKVITINLNGRAYQLEEQGYEALRRYLDEARAKLGENPDKDEIMADFEQAIADKCDTYLSANKTVVTATEIEEIIKKMGPVDGSSATKTDAADGAASSPAPKRLYRIQEGAWLFGVLNGFAAYLNVDVGLVRALYALFTLLTHGAGILIYLVLAIVMRRAKSEDEFAAAHGAAPFTAHDFIERARAEYEKFAADPGMNKAEWKARMRQLKHEWRAKSRAWRNENWREWHYEHHGHGDQHAQHTDARYEYPHRAHPVARAGGIAAMIVGGIFIAGLTVLWILALLAFLTTGIVFGIALGFGHPIWLSLLFLTALYYIVITPFKAMIMNAQCRRWGWDCRHYHSWGFVKTVLFLAALAALLYSAVHLFPAAAEIWHSIKAFLNSPR